MTEGERPDVALLASRLRHCALGLASPRQRDLAAAADLADRVATLEREKAVLEGVGRELLGLLWDEDLHWLLHPTDDQIERAEAVAHKLRAALSDSSQGQG